MYKMFTVPVAFNGNGEKQLHHVSFKIGKIGFMFHFYVCMRCHPFDLYCFSDWLEILCQNYPQIVQQQRQEKKRNEFI